MYDAVQTAADSIAAQHGGPFPKTVLVLGSGLGGFGEVIETQTIIPYKDIPGFPTSTVSGHSGQLLIGKAAGAPVACMQGRLHLYEGHPIEQVALPIRAYRALGAQTLVLTNAAGSLKPDMGPGSLMIIEDHINASGQNPLIGPNDEKIGPRFPDMSDAYDRALREKLASAANIENIDLASGVYLYTQGPSFETPAEVRMFASWGADAVGMSTAPEAIAAVHAGLKVAGLSLITNHAAGIASHKITHDETLAVGAQSFEKMSRLMLRFLPAVA
ncbi:purine-nucleoside phosphorylase [Hyphococcus sp.]|uniref:purine-nucleoside phosphorylase n=1 Tax=Hyphococcus sp. TaxID=2038636 RepID=UPI003CCC221C